MHNPAVKSCITNQLSIIGFFPNIQRFYMEKWVSNPISWSDENATIAISMNFLTELKIGLISYHNFLLIKCPRLKKLSVNRILHFQRIPSDFETFAQNNPVIEDLELFPRFYSTADWNQRLAIDTNHVAFLIQNLPKLRVFKMESVVFLNVLQVVKLIGENFDRLEYVGLSVEPLKFDEVFNYFKMELPNLKVQDLGDYIVVKKITRRA